MSGWFQTIIVQVPTYIAMSSISMASIPLPILFLLPATSYILAGEIVLGATLIMLGVASIDIRNSVGLNGSALAAGVLSIIGGVAFYTTLY